MISNTFSITLPPTQSQLTTFHRYKQELPIQNARDTHQPTYVQAEPEQMLLNANYLLLALIPLHLHTLHLVDQWPFGLL
jgi:hypothetical protein